jgi:hypothetical protein
MEGKGAGKENSSTDVGGIYPNTGGSFTNAGGLFPKTGGEDDE